MCSPKLHVEVNGFGLKKKKGRQIQCVSLIKIRRLEPTLEYETTLPSPTNLKECIKMRSMHLYQTFSGIPPTHPHPHTHPHTPTHPPPDTHPPTPTHTHTRTHTHTNTHTHLPLPRYKCGKLQICNVCLRNKKNIIHLIIS